MAMWSASASSTPTPCMTDPADQLAAADRAYREADQAVAEIGEGELERLADAYEEFSDLLDRYEEPASGSGGETFQAYVEFEGKLAEFEEQLDDDILERDAFGEAVEILDRRRLDERDFERARSTLSPVAKLVERLDDREEFRRRYREARRTVRRRIRELDQRIADLETLLTYADVDFDAPVERLRDPIETYNDAVTDAFERFRRSADAREVLATIEAAAERPLINVQSPPSELREYLASNPVGGETIPQLIEWTDFSRSKLSHYVDDPQTFLGTVGANRTYLSRLNANALCIEWPPPEAEALRWRIRELVPVIDRFAGANPLEALRTVREVTRLDEYSGLRETANAAEHLDEHDRERLESGAVERELAEARSDRQRLQDALEEYPSR